MRSIALNCKDSGVLYQIEDSCFYGLPRLCARCLIESPRSVSYSKPIAYLTCWSPAWWRHPYTSYKTKHQNLMSSSLQVGCITCPCSWWQLFIQDATSVRHGSRVRYGWKICTENFLKSGSIMSKITLKTWISTQLSLVFIWVWTTPQRSSNRLKYLVGLHSK